VSIHDLKISLTNPRKVLNEEELKELAESIKAVGIINPITVRQLEEGYEIVSGERRYRAALKAGLEIVPTFVKKLTDQQVMEIQIIENLQRVDIHPFYEAQSFDALMKKGKYTKEKIAGKLGKSLGYVTKRLQLLNLTEEIGEAFLKDEINFTVALMISRLPKEEQPGIYKTAKGSNIVQVKYAIENRYLNLTKCPFDTDDADLSPKAGSCTYCIKRTGVNIHLFDDMDANLCTDKSCYDEKVQLHIEKACKDDSELIPVSTAYNPKDETLPGVTRYSLNNDSEGLVDPVRVIVTEAPEYDEGILGKVFFVSRVAVEFDDETGENETEINVEDEDESPETAEMRALLKLKSRRREAGNIVNRNLVYKLAEHIANENKLSKGLIGIIEKDAMNIYWNGDIAEKYKIESDADIESLLPDSTKLLEIWSAYYLDEHFLNYYSPDEAEIRRLALEIMTGDELTDLVNTEISKLEEKEELELQENEDA
jgi:ParB/RepB/Spo0J family partition protein